MLALESIKQFLKPSWGKIILAFVLLEFVFLPAIYRTVAYRCFLGKDIAPANCAGSLMEDLREIRTLTLISVLISFFVSYFLIFAYNKIKTKK